MFRFALFVLIAVPLSTSLKYTSIGSTCPKRCRPTCKVPNPKDCNGTYDCTYCGDGNVWNEDTNECVKINDCPYGQGCNADPNASIRKDPPPCPSTCKHPKEMPCEMMGLAQGCVCNYGYILSTRNGRCIKPDSCPGGNPCGVNGTFASCSFDCPTEFCPINGDYFKPVCDAPYNCPSGCICLHKYVWKSSEDRTCILAQECPKRPCPENEEWNPCPSPCFSEQCNQPNTGSKQCAALRVEKQECEPRCSCKPNYKRHPQTWECIPVEDCPE